MIKTDFSEVKNLFLAYPKGFDDEYDALSDFFEELISLIPDDIYQFIIVNNKEAEERIKKIFPHKNLEPVLIKGFNEIWLRDIMGFNVGDKIVKPIYKPTYYKEVYDEGFLLELDSQVREIISKTIKKKIVDLPLIWDGGNLVTNGKVGFITDKILRDNLDKSKDEIKDLIKEYLGITPIIIPTSESDKLGHSDGYLAFLNEEEICLSFYPDKKFLQADIEYLREIEKILLRKEFKITKIYDRPVDERTRKGNDFLYSARGCYVNFLILNKVIILPEYNLPTKNESFFFINKNRQILSEKFKIVKSINADLLSKYAGVLRCTSFTN